MRNARGLNGRINDLTCEYVSGGAKPDAILACQDRFVRVLQGSEVGTAAPFAPASHGPLSPRARAARAACAISRLRVQVHYEAAIDGPVVTIER